MIQILIESNRKQKYEQKDIYRQQIIQTGENISI